MQRFPVMKFAVGAGLFVLGGLYALESFGLLTPAALGKLWPAILIVLGVAMEAEAIHRGRLSCGIVLIGVGTWLLAGSYHLFGLTFQTALPLGMTVVGSGVVIDSILEGRISTGKENGHGNR